jgi:diacylglycerol kinase (ATP)
MRIGLLSNLRAGSRRCRAIELLESVRGLPGLAHVETNHPAAVPDALYELARQDVELLVVNGGDGTLQHVLTALLSDDAFDGRVPLVAPLRGGRTNTSARDLGAGRDPLRAMARLLQALDEGGLAERSVDRRVLRVELRDGFERDVRYGMFLGCGVIQRGIGLVHAALPHRTQGLFGAALVTGSLLARQALLRDASGILEPDKIQMLVDGSRVERGASLLAMATTLDRLFLGMRPFWGTGPGPVRFTAISDGAPGLARALPGILAGRPGPQVAEAAGYLSRNARRVSLRLDCGLTVDGELLDPRPGRLVFLNADERVRFVRA